MCSSTCCTPRTRRDRFSSCPPFWSARFKTTASSGWRSISTQPRLSPGAPRPTRPPPDAPAPLPAPVSRSSRMTTAPPPSAASPAVSARPRYAIYVVLVLMVAYMLSFMDRVLISLMIDPIRSELGLGDTQVGLLVGFGFVLLYSIMGVPFGSIADNGNRRNLMVGGVLGWSAATAVSGFAGGFLSLLAARAMVGIGEATLSPAAYSTIADRFEKRKLGFAVSLYNMGVSLGGGAAMLFGGVLVAWAMATVIPMPWGELTGWRLAFVAVGLLGVPLAVV